MSKTDFISGTILEFKLPNQLGYSYCKILDFRYIRSFDGVLVKVFDHIVKNPIEDVNILREKDWLFGARRMQSLPGTRGKGAWKIKGVFISKDDDMIPDFKYSIKYSPFEQDSSKLGPWHVISDIDKMSEKTFAYKAVSHLEDTIVSPRPAIEIRTAMEYLRLNNIEIKDHFDLEVTVNKLIYAQMVKIPIYKTIPLNLRGKAIGE